MVSVEEMVKQARENAKIIRERANDDFHDETVNETYKRDCIQDAEEQEQLADWLEELRCYQNDNDFSEYADRLYQTAFNKGFNQAVEAFAKKLKEEYSTLSGEMPKEYKNVCKRIDKIARQLKNTTSVIPGI